MAEGTIVSLQNYSGSGVVYGSKTPVHYDYLEVKDYYKYVGPKTSKKIEDYTYTLAPEDGSITVSRVVLNIGSLINFYTGPSVLASGVSGGFKVAYSCDFFSGQISRSSPGKVAIFENAESPITITSNNPLIITVTAYAVGSTKGIVSWTAPVAEGNFPTPSVTVKFTNMYLSADGGLEYTPCKAPTITNQPQQNFLAGSSFTLNWSEAAGGVQNPITGYKIYRDDGQNLTLVTTISSTATSGSYTVSAPTTVGTRYIYYVQTIGTQQGYDSDLSEGYTVSCNAGQLAAPELNISSTTASAENQNVTLSWNGVPNAVNNNVTGYEIYYRTSPDGQPTLLTTVGANVRTATVASPAPGEILYFTIVATGANGNSQESNIVELRTYQAPLAPTIIFPVANTYTGTVTPRFHITVPQEPNGLPVSIYYQVGNAARVLITDIYSSDIYGDLNGITGNVTVKFIVENSMGASSYSQVAVRKDNTSIGRVFETGTVISDSAISHIAEINSLRAYVNRRRAWCGLTGMAFGNLTPGKFGDWIKIMQRFYNALVQVYNVERKTMPSVNLHFTNKYYSHPHAQTINTIIDLTKAL